MHDDSTLLTVASRITIAVGLENPMARVECTIDESDYGSLVLWLSRITRRQSTRPKNTLLRMQCGFAEIDGVGWSLFSDALSTYSSEYPVLPEDWRALKQILIRRGVRVEHAERAFRHLAE